METETMQVFMQYLSSDDYIKLKLANNISLTNWSWVSNKVEQTNKMHFNIHYHMKCKM